MIGYIILAVVIVAFVAVGIFLLVKSDYPPYKHKKSGEFRGFKATIWAQNEALLAKYDANKVAKAAYSVATAWGYLDMPELGKAQETLKHVGVLLTTKEGFQRWGYFAWNVAASVQGWTKDKIYSKSIPLVIIHEGTLDRLENASGDPMMGGQPVIHELLHAVLDKTVNSADHKHTDKNVWIEADDKLQVEEEAQNLYRKDL